MSTICARLTAACSLCSLLVPALASSQALFVGADRETTDARIATPDGRFILLQSNATNLVEDQVDTNNAQDVFVFDRATNVMRLVSHTPAGESVSGNAFSHVCGMTADGGYVVFSSNATNLASGPDANGGSDVFMWERATGDVSLLSHAHDDADKAGNGTSTTFGLRCVDAERIVFASNASDLLPDVTDGNGTQDLFLADLVAGTRRLVTHAVGDPTTAANGLSGAGKFSGDGSALLLFSRATNLVAGVSDTADSNDVFRWDVAGDTFELVSHTAAGSNVAVGSNAFLEAISMDGSFVVFSSGATAIVAGQDDTNDTTDLFQWDRSTGNVALVTHATGNTTRTANDLGALIGMSDDGRYVAFESRAFDVVPGDTNNFSDNFIWDRVTGSNVRIGESGNNIIGTSGMAGSQILTRDGRWLLHDCRLPEPPPATIPVMVCLWDREVGMRRLVSHTAGAPAMPANGTSELLWLDDDAEWAVYSTSATDVATGIVDGNATGDVYLWERATDTSRLVSHAAGLATTTGSARSKGLVPQKENRAITDDGATVLFASDAIDLVEGGLDTNGFRDVFVWDRASGTTTLVSARRVRDTIFGDGFDDPGS